MSKKSRNVDQKGVDAYKKASAAAIKQAKIDKAAAAELERPTQLTDKPAPVKKAAPKKKAAAKKASK